MKGQVTIELLLLFTVMLLVISMLSQALLHSYRISVEKSKITQQRALIENDILMYEIACNNDIDLPSGFKGSSFASNISAHDWLIILKVNSSQSSNFSGVFSGCNKNVSFI